MFAPEAIVVQSEGTYLVTMELPGARAAQVPFDVDPPGPSDLFALHEPKVITDLIGRDTRPVRQVYDAVCVFHRAARASSPDETEGDRRPVRLRALGVVQGSGYAGTVELPGGEVVTVTFVVRESPGEPVTVPESLRRFAGPDIAQVLEAVAAFHRATEVQS